MDMMTILLDLCRRAGGMARERFGTLRAGEVFRKGDADLVTAVDRDIEEFLRTELAARFPDIAFHGEEGDYESPDPDAPVFVVDPLDGTTSFVHGHPFYSVSLGLREGGCPTAGVVYLPYFDEIYWARKGYGAFHDGRPIRVSATECLGDSLAATGFACVRARLKPDNLPLFGDVIHRIRGIRRCGSAAVDLCYVADGRYDLFWEYNLKPWDVAAGIAILEEAGGRVTDLAGDPVPPEAGHLLATNGRVHDEFLAVSKQYV